MVYIDTIEKERKAVVFKYRHTSMLNLMRSFTKRKKSLKPGIRKFAANTSSLVNWNQKYV